MQVVIRMPQFLLHRAWSDRCHQEILHWRQWPMFWPRTYVKQVRNIEIISLFGNLISVFLMFWACFCVEHGSMPAVNAWPTAISQKGTSSLPCEAMTHSPKFYSIAGHWFQAILCLLWGNIKDLTHCEYGSSHFSLHESEIVQTEIVNKKRSVLLHIRRHKAITPFMIAMIIW